MNLPIFLVFECRLVGENEEPSTSSTETIPFKIPFEGLNLVFSSQPKIYAWKLILTIRENMP